MTCKTTEQFALNTRLMKKTLESQNIIVLKADKTRPSVEIDKALAELGNTAGGIPYFAVYRPNEETVHFGGTFVSPAGFLREAGIDPDAAPVDVTTPVSGSVESSTKTSKETTAPIETIQFDPIIDLSPAG